MLEKNNFSSNIHPSIFIIGAQKSGTSTLFQWLIQDNRLLFPKIKETHYFTSNYKKGLKWYLNLYNKRHANKYRCEIDPSYLFYDFAIDRILKLNKKAKFIIILRSPLERAYSHYLMSVYKGYEKLSFIDAISLEKSRISKDEYSYNNFSYLKRSQYSKQIKLLLKKTDRCLFLKFDNLFLNDHTVNNISKIYKFLDLPSPNNINFSISSNHAKQYKSKFFTNLLYSDNMIRTIFRMLIPSYINRFKIKSILSNLNSDKISNSKQIYNELIKKIPLKYIKWHNSEVEGTSKLTNLNLKDWLI